MLPHGYPQQAQSQDPNMHFSYADVAPPGVNAGYMPTQQFYYYPQPIVAARPESGVPWRKNVAATPWTTANTAMPVAPIAPIAVSAPAVPSAQPLKLVPQYTTVPAKKPKQSRWDQPPANPGASVLTSAKFRQYIVRAYQTVHPDHEKEMETELKLMIDQIKKVKNFEDVNWDEYPLPKACRKNKTEAQKRKSEWTITDIEDSSAKRLQAANSTITVMTNRGVVGTCQTLEKRYFRLTEAPNPALVRPQEVLEKAMVALQKRYDEGANYTYICDQMKAIRQDLTVQHIENQFTVNVYEIHARLALDHGDLGEYNQCQSQLWRLYRIGLNGSVEEFTAYRILYLLHTQQQAALNALMAELKPEQQKGAVAHAMAVWSAVEQGNHYRLVRLAQKVPNKGGKLLGSVMQRVRVAGLVAMSYGYQRQSLSSQMAKQLGMSLDYLQEFVGNRVPSTLDKAREALVEWRQEKQRVDLHYADRNN